MRGSWLPLFGQMPSFWLRILFVFFVLLLPVTGGAQNSVPSGDLHDGGVPVWQAEDRWLDRTDYWRKVRQGEEGLVNQPDRGILIQSLGNDWSRVHSTLIPTYGGQLVVVTSVALLAMILLLNARLRAFAGRVADHLRRRKGLDRAAHWLTASSFLFLGGTGLIILYGRRILAPLISREVFAGIARVAKLVHDQVSWIFMVSVVLLVLIWIRDNLPNAGRALKTAVKGGGTPRISPLSATEQLVFWSLIGGGVVVSYSGMALLFPLSFAELKQMQLMQIVHSLSSLTLATLFFGHVFIATMSIRTSARKLLEAKEELERRVEERTAELRQANAHLEIAKTEAEEAHRSKNRFTAAVSHDLLQPLSAARLMIATLRDRRSIRADRDLVDRIHLALSGAEDLLSDLLDISKLDMGGLTPQMETVSSGLLIDVLVGEFEPVARKRGIALRSVRVDRPVLTDPHLLMRVLRNLLSNAIRYTPQGKVLLGCRCRGGMLSFQVWDSGIGIPESRLESIFQEFHRESEAADLHKRASGLGLAIVDRIATVLGCRIGVRSRVGEGSVFSVDIPVATLPLQDSQPAHPGENTLEGVSVLVLDNDAQMLAGMAALLAEWGCHVLSHSSPQAAIEALSEYGEMPDLLIVDYHLGDSVGLEFLERARRYVGMIPMMVVTADRSSEVHAAIASGGYPVLLKPVRPAKLRALMTHLLCAPVAD